MDTKELELMINGKSEKSTLGKIWTLTKILSIFTWSTGKFIAKNTPTAVGIAWEVKKEVSQEITAVIQEVIKEQKQLKLDEEIKQLSQKGEKK